MPEINSSGLCQVDRNRRLAFRRRGAGDQKSTELAIEIGEENGIPERADRFLDTDERCRCRTRPPLGGCRVLFGDGSLSFNACDTRLRLFQRLL